jgi:hypothetical protein
MCSFTLQQWNCFAIDGWEEVIRSGIDFRVDNDGISRFIQTESMNPSAEQEILNSQRLKRPSSPHMTIYQYQLSWVGSIANRMTGVGLSVC